MTVASTGTASPLVVNGLISGITTPKVIQALLQSYQVPIDNLARQQATLQAEAADYRTLSTDFQAVQTAAQTLVRTSQWNLATANSSNPSVATALAGTGAQTGSLAFTVTQLAQADVLASSQGVSSTGQVVTNASSLLVATGAAALGFSGLSAGSGLGLGSYTITVTQASTAAEVTGTGALPTTVTVATGANVLTVTVNGTTSTLQLAAGTYTPTQLVTAVDAAAKTAGAAVRASVAPTGALRISTDRQGSSATLAIVGGTAATALGLSAGATGSGADAVVTVGGTATTLSSITPGQAVTLHAPGTAAVTATVATTPDAAGSLIAAGSAQAANVSTGSGSLSTVVSAINSSGLAATASAVQLSSGAYILQVSADKTGTAGAVTVDATAFAGSALGQLTTIAQAQNAEVTVGGSNGYTLSSSTDTFANLLPGTSVTAVSTGQATVTVTPDVTGEATRVQKLVTAADKALTDIQTYAGYTTAAKKGGPLMGSAIITNLRDQILSIFGSVSGTSSLGDLSNAGITLTKTGTVDFTKQKFTAAFATDPSEVGKLFTQGGTFTPSATANAGAVTFAFAGNDTLAGTYTVTVSHSATKATDAGAALTGGTVSVGETLTVQMGNASATYTTTSGEQLSSIATGLNQAFAGAGLGLTAQVVAGTGTTQLEIVSNAYGSAASFSVTSTATGTGTTGLGGTAAGTAVTFAGTNVAGTIGGVTATGNGQYLVAPTSAPLDGLAVLVSASGITATTTLGTIAYHPGVAQQLVTAMTAATNPIGGSIVGTIKSLTTQATGLNGQISMYQGLEKSQQAVLQQEFVTMETTLGKLKNESSMLTSQLSKLPGF